ncbi:MAG: serine--tRNA ligase [Chloroflexi bacterium]|nr:serine--tRNA ligase [Chloroflexota bacterium]MCY3697854.1 serine--tRNA ligase [Chloroflexota bacterium]
MISAQMIREQADVIRRSLERRRVEAPLDEAIAVDEQRRSVLVELEELRASRNTAGRAIGKAKDSEERQRLIAAQRESASRIDELEERLRDIEESLNVLLAEVPNVVGDETPDGDAEEANVEVRSWGARRAFEFEPKPHWELGESLGIIDIERAAAMSGSRMYALRGAGARLQRALIGWFLDCHGATGYEECYVPAMVRQEAMRASGQLPKFRDNLYRDEEEDYYFVPTAEVPLTNMHADEILSEDQLPIRYAAHTPCFRREKTSAGRDVRGIKRVHQFEKVEMYQFTTPETSASALDEMLESAESLLQGLELEYRVLQICSGDIGFNASVSYDLEIWAPGAQEWLEVSSVSNCTDFQARRANIRYRPETGKGTRFVHTLNGSGLALPRTIAALLENGQQEDGSVMLPEVLASRMGSRVIA